MQNTNFLTATGKQKVYYWYTVFWRITSFTENIILKNMDDFFASMGHKLFQ